jgi:tartrate dehydrogenase/decarboxylase / D-malate dehydrogenase
MNEYRIAVIGGDGVGPEVVAAGMGVLGTAASGFSLAWEHLPWGSDYYKANGVMMPADGLDVLERFDAIYLGAVGRPDVPDHVTLWGLLCRSGSGSTCT